MSKLLVMIVGIACAAAVAAAEGQPPRKVWTARDVIIAQGGVPPEDMPAAAQATPGEPAAPAAAPAKAKGKKAKAAAKAKKKKVAAKGAKKRPAKRAKGRG